MSALHIAVEHGHTEVVEELVLFHKMDKSDLNARDNVRLLYTFVLPSCLIP